MNLFLRECRANLKALLIWCGCSILLLLSVMAKYGAMTSSDQEMNQLIAKMPKAIQIFMGGGAFDLTTIGGYYGVTHGYLLLISAIYALLLGNGILAKEERDKTAEFLLTKPVPRKTILRTKLFMVFICIILFTLMLFVTAAATVKAMESGAQLTGAIARLCVVLALTQLIFAAFGLALAAFDKDPRRSARTGAGILFVTYFLSLALSLNDNLSFLRPLTPFAYFDAAKIITGGSLDLLYTVISLAVSAVLCAAALILYNRRDMKV